ncbi:MAG: hypothetical protein IJK26_10550 [Clostridia bacterium]|nr:hypothetical protein [Clostridia bacterium]
MKKYAYISQAISEIKNKKAQQEVERELSAHIDDLTEFYIKQGFSQLEAEEKAVEDMGEVDEIAEKFGKLHNVNVAQNTAELFFSGVGVSFIWASLNLMFSLIIYGSGILQSFPDYDLEGERPEYNYSILIALLIVSLLNYLLLILYYKLGKRIKLEIKTITGVIIFLLPHIILMACLFFFEELTNGELAYQAISWWTVALHFVFEDLLSAAYRFTENLMETVSINIALTFIPYIAAILGMLKAKRKGE